LGGSCDGAAWPVFGGRSSWKGGYPAAALPHFAGFNRPG
jgi:hypothetical protein